MSPRRDGRPDSLFTGLMYTLGGASTISLGDTLMGLLGDRLGAVVAAVVWLTTVTAMARAAMLGRRDRPPRPPQ